MGRSIEASARGAPAKIQDPNNPLIITIFIHSRASSKRIKPAIKPLHFQLSFTPMLTHKLHTNKDMFVPDAHFYCVQYDTRPCQRHEGMTHELRDKDTSAFAMRSCGRKRRQSCNSFTADDTRGLHHMLALLMVFMVARSDSLFETQRIKKSSPDSPHTHFDTRSSHALDVCETARETGASYHSSSLTLQPLSRERDARGSSAAVGDGSISASLLELFAGSSLTVCFLKGTKMYI